MLFVLINKHVMHYRQDTNENKTRILYETVSLL